MIRARKQNKAEESKTIIADNKYNVPPESYHPFATFKHIIEKPTQQYYTGNLFANIEDHSKNGEMGRGYKDRG